MVSFTLGELSQKVGGELFGNQQLIIKGASQIETAQPGQITFLANMKYKEFLSSTKASAIIVDKRIKISEDISFIRVDDVYYRFLQIFLLFNPPKDIIKTGIHPSAEIHPSVKMGKNISIGPYVVIDQNCTIGDNTKILPGCVLMRDVKIGNNCLLYPLVSIREECEIGNNVIIHNGAVIGSDGFGFAPFQGRFHKIPQIGQVIIEDDVEIGANSTIDRAMMGKTVIKKGAKLDNLIQIAHNVEVGESTVMAAQSGISGSTKIGHHVMIAGQAGTVGHITIGDYVQIGAQTGVSKSIPDNEIVFGSPARPIMRMKRIEAIVNQLPELNKKMREIENLLEKLSRNK